MKSNNDDNMSRQTSLDVLFTPADFETLKGRDLSRTTCVVFDVLRATSSMITALANGASGIIPVATIPEALAIHRNSPEVLLAGERDGLRITSDLTGSVPFHLGNSPREFTAEAVRGKTIVMTTTNGTRALRACMGAERVLAGSFLNLGMTATAVLNSTPQELLVICSGTFEEAAYEDVLAAGALCDAIWHSYGNGRVSDSALMALLLYRAAGSDIAAALAQAKNGKRLLSRKDLAEDVAFCSEKNTVEMAATLDRGGTVCRCGID